MTTRRFPPPWTAEEPDPKLDRQCFIVRDANGYIGLVADQCLAERLKSIAIIRR
jgi:hypothetical protein